MAIANGSRHSMAYIEESTFGTTPVSPTFTPLRHTGTTLGLSKDAIQSEELRSDRQNPEPRHGNDRVAGDVNVEISYGSFDDLLEAVLCGTWTVDTPSVGTDQLNIGTTRRSFTIERFFEDVTQYHRFTGCEFNTLSLNVSPNAMVTATFGIVGAGMSTGTTALSGSSYTAGTTSKPMDSFTGTLQEGGGAISVVTEMSISLENGLEPLFVVGSKTAIANSIGRASVSGNLTVYFENSTMIDKFINETETSLQFETPDGTNKYIWKINQLKFTGGQPDVSGEGPITLSMPFEAYLDALTIERSPV